MQQRRLGLQTWPVSMETGEEGVTSPDPGSWPPDPLPNFALFLGEHLSACHYSLPLLKPCHVGMGWTLGKGTGGTEKPGGGAASGSQEILPLSSPAGLGKTSAPPQHTPDTGHCPPLCTTSSDMSLVRLMTMHRAPSSRLCRSWAGGREDLGRSQGWMGTGELSQRDLRKETDTVQDQREADTDRQRHQQRQR